MRRAIGVAKTAYAHGQRLVRSLRDRDLLRQKSEVDDALRRFVQQQSNPPAVRKVLLDGAFLNPGYWYRMQIFRAALGLDRASEVGVTGKHNASECRRTLRSLGVQDVVAFGGAAPMKKALLRDARQLFSTLHSVEDVLDLRLPLDVPAALLYDTILKRQREACVDHTDPRVEQDILDFLCAIRSAEKMVEKYDPDLLAMSHAITEQCSTLAWVGAKAGKEVVVLFGNYGTPRFWRIRRPDQIFDSVDRPSGDELSSLPGTVADSMAIVGSQYLSSRIHGGTDDIGAQYAYGIRRSESDADNLRAALNWKSDRPVIAVYASSWFDFPHSMGMREFRDLLDWILATLDVAKKTPAFNWLFRAHPCDKWYGGKTLADFLPGDLPDHVRLAPDEWSGLDMMAVTTALVTYHGTAGVEYAALGKPALVADRGWYHDCGFVVWPQRREEYMRLLETRWFDKLKPENFSRRAAIFAGWYFCVPEWQRDGVLPDDSIQLKMYPGLLRQLSDCGDVMNKEVQTVRAWYESGELYYHTYKMRRASRYRLSNVT